MIVNNGGDLNYLIKCLFNLKFIINVVQMFIVVFVLEQ